MGLDLYALNPRREECARCGDVAKGSAQIGGERYCHEGDQPTCYMLEQWEDADDPLAAHREWAADGYRTVSFQDVLAHFKLTEEDLSR